VRLGTTVSPIIILAVILGSSLLVGCASDTSSDTSFQRGTAGESCRARNDCALGLACINETCVPASPPLSVTGKACYRVECGSDAECCANFVPASGCGSYAAACQANPNDCDAYRRLCQCNRACVNELCADKEPGCSTNAECSSPSSPYCVEKRCVGCREHGDCLEGARCIEGSCKAQCKTNENCPDFHACQAGTCVRSGCTTNRECSFVLGHPRGRCANGECFVGCVNDTECDATAFEVCHSGRCTFVGCASNAECRSYLGLSNTLDNIRAVCR
jgi:hypothetical protein